MPQATIEVHKYPAQSGLLKHSPEHFTADVEATFSNLLHPLRGFGQDEHQGVAEQKAIKDLQGKIALAFPKVADTLVKSATITVDLPQ